MSAAAPVFVLGGAQTDFSRSWSREGSDLAAMLAEPVQGALVDAGVDATDVEVGHVANFGSEIYCGQAHLGGLLVEADPAFTGLPTSRHEAACASGSVAVLAAMADLEAERYDVACVVGVEMMRNVPTRDAVSNLGAAAWVPYETEGVPMVWPEVFAALGDEYDRRYGLESEHLAALARSSFENARRNPNAQTRSWELPAGAFDENEHDNPVVAGRLRRHDCSQITDGGAAVILASVEYAAEWAASHGLSLDSIPRIRGWGHSTARMSFADKLRDDGPYVFPHVRGAILDAFDRADVADVSELDAIECHDCFTTTHYMAIDHFGITAPGESWKAIEDGTVFADGPLPVNPSGGLIGCGHPVGASGVRMLLDAAKQVQCGAGDYQVDGARTAATLNIGGSATTTVSFVVGADS
ncbi:MAG: acetyl-CoA acetyltransferase [Acidimicrobiia bacterium]